jgi:hypothetical protein
MRKWIWASTILTVATACGLYAFASWADKHPMSLLGYGARLATVVGMSHAKAAPKCPAPADAPRANPNEPCVHAVARLEPCPASEINEPIVVEIEDAQPLPESAEPPTSDPVPMPPIPVEESVPPVLVMPPCPEDEFTAGSLPSPINLKQCILLPVGGNGPVSDCQIDPNYHHQYPGCPWMGGCLNIPAYQPATAAERARVQPSKTKWMMVRAFWEMMGWSGMEECEEPTPALPDEVDLSNLSDIVF